MLHAYDGSLRRCATGATADAIRKPAMLPRDGLELDALENVFPDKEQGRIDNPDHQEGE